MKVARFITTPSRSSLMLLCATLIALSACAKKKSKSADESTTEDTSSDPAIFSPVQDTSSTKGGSTKGGTSSSGSGGGTSSTPAPTIASNDTTPPVAGNSGNVSTANIQATAVDLSWAAGADGTTATAALQYKVVYSASNNISTVSDAGANGTVGMAYTANTTSTTVSSLAQLTAYYFTVLVKDAAGNETAYSVVSATTLSDPTPPTPGASGTLTVSNESLTGLTLTWTAGSDNLSATADLSYEVRQSSTNNLSTLSDAENNGTIAAIYATNSTTANITGLSPSTTYYFNVVVKDGAGNRAIYAMDSGTTLADTTGPAAGGSGGVSTITASGLTISGVTLTWNAASDNHTAVSGLSYEVRQSTSNNLGSVSDAETNGSIATAYTTNLTTTTISGLSPATTYYFSVIVKDAAENKTIYSTVSATTPTNPPDPLTAFTSSTGSGWFQVGLSLTYPASKAAYSRVLIYRSLPSDSSPATAPVCGSGDLIRTITNFTANSLAFEDYTPRAGKYYGYRACIYNSNNDETSSNVITTAQSATGPTLMRSFDAAYRTGTATSGDISGDTSTTWTDLTGTANLTMVGFDNTASSGWVGTGTAADPYRVVFDGTNDRMTMSTTFTSAAAFSFWFKTTVDDANTRTLFFAESGLNDSMAYLTSGYVYAIFTGFSSSIRTPIDTTGKWHHVVVERGGDGNMKLYLDGHYTTTYGSSSLTPTSTLYIGSNASGANLFQGEMAEFQVYSSTLSDDQVLSLYAASRPKFYGTTASINRILSAYGSNSDAHTIKVIGSGLSEVVDASVDGNTAGSLAYRNGSILTFTAPTGAYSGRGDITLEKVSGTVQASSAHVYSEAPMTGIINLLDPQNVDSKGTPGSSTTGNYWLSLTNIFYGGLRNFGATASSGFTGDGTSGNAYRLQCDGTDDFVRVQQLSARTFAVWFNADTLVGTLRYVYGASSNSDNFVTVQNSTLSLRYSGGTAKTTTISAGVWYQAIVTYDGTDFYAYVGAAADSDLTLVGSGSATTLQNTNATVILCASSGGASNFDGGIGEFRTYSTYLDGTTAEALFDATKTNFQ